MHMFHRYREVSNMWSKGQWDHASDIHKVYIMYVRVCECADGGRGQG